MIVEGVVVFLVDTFGAFFGMLASFGLSPTWPNWMTGDGEGTVRGSFTWISTGLGPFAAWINLPLMGSVASLVFAMQAGFLSWALVHRVLAFVRGSSV